MSAVQRAGGGAVLLPPSGLDPRVVLSVLGGLVVTGGRISTRVATAPRHINKQTHPDPKRDAWEIALCRRALADDLPLLAICRGLQVLNVSLGDTLHQHLPDLVCGGTHRPPPGQESPTKVKLRDLSTVASVLGAETTGYCHHHQALDRLGAGVEGVGFAPDGTVEAAELPAKTFTIGVQWHPEENRAGNRLLVVLVQAAGQYGAKRRAAGDGPGGPS